MPQVQIIYDEQQLNVIRQQIAAIKKNARVALRRAVSKTVTGTKAHVAKELSAVTTLKSAYIKDCVSSNLEIETDLGIKGQITLLSGKYGPGNKRSYWTPLYRYQYRKNKKTVSVKIYKNGATQQFQHIFLRTFASGHTGIFKTVRDASGNVVKSRTGRPKIKEMVGPALTQIYLNQPGLAATVETTAGERLITELQRQLNYLLTQQSLAP